MRYLILIFVSLFLVGCASKEMQQEIDDLRNYVDSVLVLGEDNENAIGDLSECVGKVVARSEETEDVIVDMAFSISDLKEQAVTAENVGQFLYEQLQTVYNDQSYWWYQHEIRINRLDGVEEYDYSTEYEAIQEIDSIKPQGTMLEVNAL